MRPNDVHGSRVASYGRRRPDPVVGTDDGLTAVAMSMVDVIAAYRAGRRATDPIPAERAPVTVETGPECSRCHDPLRRRPEDGLCPTCRRLARHPSIHCPVCERETRKPGPCHKCLTYIRRHQ
ncbi:hypothetical protein D2E24_1046 [Bifidobacterium samirii]|uniref:Uncharacterized protein n=1 Tax=Bifidobacterium samirii TaxID=2306974 RepID=A0A430FUD2_9BIFI|nr:hypothetical protein D2E24_1046 [Bifidobacterium samirii]